MQKVFAIVKLISLGMQAAESAASNPNAVQYMSEHDVERAVEQCLMRSVYIFLDYDGTLTPIVPNPKDAKLSAEGKDVLIALAKQLNVSVVTGRSIGVVSEFLGEPLTELINIAGSHGFDIHMLNGQEYKAGNHEVLAGFRDFVKKLKLAIETTFPSGSFWDETSHTISVHYRNVPFGEQRLVRDRIEELVQEFPDIQVTPGKMVWECKIKIDWNKGKAVEWILSQYLTHHHGDEPPLVIYIGDDVTDEDGFKQVNRYAHHMSILVNDEEELGRKTDAGFRLENPSDVLNFLKRLTSRCPRDVKTM